MVFNKYLIQTHTLTQIQIKCNTFNKHKHHRKNQAAIPFAHLLYSDIHMYVCIYVYIYIFIFIYIYTYACVCLLQVSMSISIVRISVSFNGKSLPQWICNAYFILCGTWNVTCYHVSSESHETQKIYFFLSVACFLYDWIIKRRLIFVCVFCWRWLILRFSSKTYE